MKAEEISFAPQRKLVWWRFRKHKLAVVGLVVIGLLYLMAAFAEFLSPSVPGEVKATYAQAPPRLVHVSFGDGPFLYVDGYKSTVDTLQQRRVFETDESQRIALRLFARGEPYRMWGLIPSDRHLLGPVDKDAPVFLLGADRSGRDLLTRIVYGARISLSVGLVGVLLSFVLGMFIGGLSGYLGGTVDLVIQRVIEFIISIPTLPLWLGLAAAIPRTWDPLKVYVAIVVVLSLIGWTGMARVMRSRFLQIRGEDYVLAAELDGASRLRVVGRHMLPAFTSHIIASLTLTVPGMILGETALSFLGLGLQPPTVSWGVLLKEAQSVQALATTPWLLAAGAAVVVTVVALNFVGDGLRDAADPYEN